MWLDELQLTDFRGFRHLKLDLRRQLTVVIGVNGAGKSSLVDAIEIAASHAVQAVFQHHRAIELTHRDVRQGQATCQVGATFEGMALQIRRSASGNTERELQRHAEVPMPPLCMSFKSNRAVLKVDVMGRLSVVSGHPAWNDDFISVFTSFEHGEQWFHTRENLENQERVRSKQLEYVDPELDFVRRTIEAMLPRYSDPHIDRSRPVGPTASQLVLTKDGQEFTADMLSDGERSLLVLAMTIARRLSLLGSTQSGEHSAIVVIDEIDLHLHPKWQREVIPALLRAFPSCQFIVTTHSPQVIGSVPRESIVVLDDFAAYGAAAPTQGRDSNAILEEIMDVRERDEASQTALDEIARLIDRDEQEQARSAYSFFAGASPFSSALFIAALKKHCTTLRISVASSTHMLARAN